MMPYLAAVFGFSSTLSLTILTLSPSCPAISSSAGAIMRHGPHHSAQKSTTTGSADFNTSDSKLASDTLPTAMAITLLSLKRGNRPQKSVRAGTYECSLQASRHSRGRVNRQGSVERVGRKLHKIRNFGPDQRGAYGPVGVQVHKHGTIGRQLL